MEPKNIIANDETLSGWNENANLWNEKLGTDGNDFFRILQ